MLLITARYHPVNARKTYPFGRYAMKIRFPERDEKDLILIKEISEKCGVTEATAGLLVSRNVRSAKQAERFLSPGKKWFYDPFLLGGVKEGVAKISDAKSSGKKVIVFGDYDADGICACTVLAGCLEIFGVKPVKLIPEREEGYGLNVKKVLAETGGNPALLITVDCGISDADKIAELKNAGVEVVVTDHHEPPEMLPDCVCINPKIKGSYPFDGLCGAGVAYKLGSALIGRLADGFLDFAAVATVADSMDLIDENRDIVYEGLKIFKRDMRPVFRGLISETAKEITAQTLAFAVAPRINAGGRMGDAFCALKLFSATEEKEIFDLSVKLNGYNIERQATCEEVFYQAVEKITTAELYNDRVILVRGEDWKTGVIGIVSAKLVERFNKPVIVFAGFGGTYKGSARSVEGVNIFEAITAVKDDLIAFGGHSQAAGLSVTDENYEKLRRDINAYAEENFPATPPEKELFADGVITQEIPIRFAREIEILEPFGVANRKPLFAVRAEELRPLPLKTGSPHYSFTTPFLEILDFNGEKDVPVLSRKTPKTLVVELNLSTFHSRESLKGFLKNIVLDGDDCSDLETEFFYRAIKGGNGEIPTAAAVGSRAENTVKRGYGTAYIVTDYRTVANKDLPVKVYPFAPENESGENCVIICPQTIPSAYKRAVYLDIPLYARDHQGMASTAEGAKFSLFDGIVKDRRVFAEVFRYLAEKGGRNFYDALSFFTRSAKDGEPKTDDGKAIDIKQSLVCAEVFFELGFFRAENGRLIRDPAVKRPLDDSAIYRLIKE